MLHSPRAAPMFLVLRTRFATSSMPSCSTVRLSIAKGFRFTIQAHEAPLCRHCRCQVPHQGLYTTLPWPNQPMHQAPLLHLKTTTQAVTTIRVSLHHTNTQGFRFTIQAQKCSDVSRPTIAIQAHQGFRFTSTKGSASLRCGGLFIYLT